MGVDARILLVVKDKPSPEELKRWSWALGASVGAEKLWLDKEKGRPAITLSYDFDKDGNKVYTGKTFHQDGDPIVAEEEWLLVVHTWTRYYGVGYERGDLLGLCAIAEWCEVNIPNCEVWYGGDSSGVLAEPWPEIKRRQLRRHMYSSEGRAYYRHFESAGFPTPDCCSLCVGSVGFNRNGWGGGGTTEYIAVSCPGCGESFASRNGGQTWTKPEKD